MPMSNKNPFDADLDIDRERWLKLDSMKTVGWNPESAQMLIEGFSSAPDRHLVSEAARFLAGLTCSGRESNYRQHAVRVADYFRRYSPLANARGVALALLHNVVEVGHAELPEIRHAFGPWMANACRVLTVDRHRQANDAEYMKEYYQALYKADPEVQQEKILDKLDNLFVLFLNPSEDVRTWYLADIEKWLVPMIRSQMPALQKPVEQLIFENRNHWKTLNAQYLHAQHASGNTIIKCERGA